MVPNLQICNLVGVYLWRSDGGPLLTAESSLPDAGGGHCVFSTVTAGGCGGEVDRD